MNLFLKIYFFIVLTVFAFFPFFVSAAEIHFRTDKNEVETGEQFLAEVFVSSDELLNAIEGRLVFSNETLQAQKILDGNSAINFWVEKPNLKTGGEIAFSGITPGGFSGKNILVFSIIFEVKKTGLISINLRDTKVLLNDGLGTEAPLAIYGITVSSVEFGNKNIKKEEILTDKNPPENFSPLIVSNKYLFEGKYALVFATQDKGSGVDYYEIKEYKFPLLSFFVKWKKIESPFLLRDQKLRSIILLKAIDGLGNERIVKINPTNSLLWYEIVFYWVIIISISFCVFLASFKIWKKKNI
jgi:hypothetical protein